MTKNEVAQYLGVTASVVTRLQSTGKLKCDPVGKRKVFHQDDVDEYLSRFNLRPAPQDHPRISDDIPELVGLSFFSGAGGLDLGLERAGIRMLLQSENNLQARMSIDHNWPDAALVGDIQSLNGAKVREMARIQDADIHIMAGGPPCQAFSTAGARRAFNDARGNVFLKYLDLAAELRPQYLVIENVRGLLSTPYPLTPSGVPVKGGALQLVLRRLTAMGYATTFNLYNAANFGAAQIRERVIIIAKRDGSPMPWLTPTHSNDPTWGLPPWRTFGDAVQGLEHVPHDHTQFPEKRLRYFRKLSAGQYWTSLPKEEQPTAMGKAYKLPGGKTGFYRRIRFDRPAPTLVTSPTMPATDLCHPEELRPLSVQEYKAVQGLPQDWWIAGSIPDCYRQIGNAVPVELGEAIGRAILKDMRGESPTKDFEDFPYSRYRQTSNRSWVRPQAA